jgi:hypothetical protein
MIIWLPNIELGSIWKEAVVAYFMISWNVPEGIEENNEEPQSG